MADAARRVVVMGVSGCGKSTLAPRLAQALGGDYVEGDELHPPENVARMAAGTPLTDADRAGWLQAIAERIGLAAASGASLVVTCSALRRRYRDRLREPDPTLAFVHLHAGRDVLGERLARRQGHYMPASLLGSQLATLEPPDADERALTLDAGRSTETQCAAALAWLRATRG